MNKIKQFQQKDIEILSKERVYDGFFKMEKVLFRHKLFAGGMSEIVCRELLLKGAASVVVAYDPRRDNVILVEQVRIGAYDPHSTRSPWLLELIAGMVESGETAERVAMRESAEEAGVQLEKLKYAFAAWDSPGGQSERLYFFAGKVDSSRARGIHGLAAEHEDIKVHVVSREQAYQWVCDGTIDNGAAIMGLQWLQLNYQCLQQEWAD
ncbi:ADP-ribose diphosphatase [Pasteurellaceae bacterium LIM206]|nr:ADP-ribose diphosphatase [Pasteurellaceae bacterium LIM206]